MKNIERKREYQKEWINERRNSYILENGPCINCGSLDKLEIDHIDPKQKKYKISNIWSRNLKLIKKELKKCQILCNRCHKEKTKKQKRDALQHGISRYRIGCRCDVCKKAKQEENRLRYI